MTELSQIYGEELSKMVFSPDWKVKISALEQMERTCIDRDRGDDDWEEDLLLNVMNPVAMMTADKNAQVVNQAMTFLTNVFKKRFNVIIKI